MEEKNKRIVMADRNGNPIGLFGSVEEASALTGYKKSDVGRCLVGTKSYIGKEEIHFFYEVTAGELRQAAQRKQVEKEKEKLEQEWKI